MNSKNVVSLIGILLGIILVFLVKCARQTVDYSGNLPETVDFNYHIRPILSNSCFVCHGPDSSSRKASLRLDTYEAATSRLPSGNIAISPGKPKSSELLNRLHSQDPTTQMPPPEMKVKLSEREIALIEKWIQQGATWKKHWALESPNSSYPLDLDSLSETIDQLIYNQRIQHGLSASPSASPDQLLRRAAYILTGLPPTPEEYARFIQKNDWSYEAVVDYYLDAPQFGERWARHWMDLVRYGEFRGHEYDYPIYGAWHYRDYLIRAFNDDIPYDQFILEHLAGDLLENPRINDSLAMNESLLATAYMNLGEGKHSPVDVKEEESIRIDNLIDVTSKTFQALTVSCAKCHDHKFDPIPTTDYYAMYGMFESTRIGPRPVHTELTSEPRLQRIDQIKNQISKIPGEPKSIDPLAQVDSTLLGDFRMGTFGQWQVDGTAFGPAPVTRLPVLSPENQWEWIEQVASSRYYTNGLYGALRSPNFLVESDTLVVRAAGNHGLVRVISDNFQLIQYPLYGSLEMQINDPELQDYVLDISMVKGHKAYIEILPGYFEKHHYYLESDHYIDVAFVSLDPLYIPEDEAIRTHRHPFSRTTYDQALSQEYEEITQQVYDSAMYCGVFEGEAVFSPVFIRGSRNNLSKEKVPHGFLSCISDPSDFSQQGSGRLNWAQHLINDQNPLTARVMANRIWHHLFGKGIVTSVDNFGLQGTLPSHPVLLDHLALTFREGGWSVKSLIRGIMLSETFQLSSTALEENESVDPTNLYLHHYPLRRLEAEAIRDGILAVSGQLNPEMYGPPVPIYLTPFMTGRGKPLRSGPLDGDGRRSIYQEIRRNFLPHMMLVFDMPIPFSTFGNRNVTNVPAQSLTLMNDSLVHHQAHYWAESITDQNSTFDQNIESIYITAFSRLPSENELSEARHFFEAWSEQHPNQVTAATENLEAWKAFCHMIFNLKEFIYLI